MIRKELNKGIYEAIVEPRKKISVWGGGYSSCFDVLKDIGGNN